MTEKTEMIIEANAYARAGLLGNPSDGYNGKSISMVVKNFCAQVWLEPSPELRIELSEEDSLVYPGISDLVDRIKLYGYYGGDRLIKGTIKKFAEYCNESQTSLPKENFTLKYKSSIPRQIGLAGSSAIATATMRALTRFYGVEIPKDHLPSLLLDVELLELGINAGLMDRVVQIYEGCVYMDFNPEVMKKKGHGIYEPLDPGLLPDLYIAYKPDLGKVSGQVLNDIRVGFDKGDPLVIDTLHQIAALAEEGKEALLQGDVQRLHGLMNKNFDLRSKIMKISRGNHELIETARRCGASAKFAGSGGAIIGIFEGERMFNQLSKRMKAVEARVIKPVVV